SAAGLLPMLFQMSQQGNGISGLFGSPQAPSAPAEPPPPAMPTAMLPGYGGDKGALPLFGRAAQEGLPRPMGLLQ
ncbi:MAG: hypothetical protein P8Y47_12290, partial [Alphaproteobacteria bacterium]